MSIFNSLGSNYDFGFVLKSLFAKNKEEYKSNLMEFLEKKYGGLAILVYKGREAITLALEILNFPKESKVAINGFTCYAVYRAIETAGYTPVCLDLDNNLNLNFSANELSKTIKHNPKIKAVIIQNTLGYPCDIEEIAKVCRENNIILIEDLAHSVGAIYANGKEAGTIGDFVVFSFSQDKIIDAVSGGALIIRNKKYLKNVIPSRSTFLGVNSVEESPASKQQLLDRLYPLLTYKIRNIYRFGVGKILHFTFKSLGVLSKPMNESFYTKYSLPNWYACLGMDAFANLNKNLQHRRKIATIYSATLNKKITSNFINKNINSSSNLRYPIFVEKRSALISYLKKEGVYLSDIWYDEVDENLKNCQIAANKILNLPTHKNISEKSAKILSYKINQWLKLQ